uniref:Uncharacterized protein n=1 Tax=Cacopsylla melanoneura TaxID=428564 RepID=A0A8D9BU61_9HEMI
MIETGRRGLIRSVQVVIASPGKDTRQWMSWDSRFNMMQLVIIADIIICRPDRPSYKLALNDMISIMLADIYLPMAIHYKSFSETFFCFISYQNVLSSIFL